MNLRSLSRRLASATGLLICAAPIFAQQLIKPDTSKYTTIRIDPAQAGGGNASDVFDESNYIPLETTEESLLAALASWRSLTTALSLKTITPKAFYFLIKKASSSTSLQDGLAGC